jgi:hypothetical protein
VCHQSVGLIAREVEAAGIPTLCMTSAYDITQAVNPPRAVFLNYPLGHQTGKPDDSANQRAIVLAALKASPAGSSSCPTYGIRTIADGRRLTTRPDSCRRGRKKLPPISPSRSAAAATRRPIRGKP